MAGGKPVDKVDKRSLVRQMESADAIAWAGYHVLNDPIVTPDEIKAGIRPNKIPIIASKTCCSTATAQNRP